LRKRKILIIGGGTAGLVAAYRARETNTEAEITVLSEELYLPYRKPSLSCVIKGTISRPDEIAMYPLHLLESKKIRLLRGVKAYRIDVDERTVNAKDVKTKTKKTLSYDALVLATGGYGFIPPVKGVHLKNVFTLRTFDDALRISEMAERGKSAVVVGAGFVALEIAEALARRDVKVTLIVRSRILRRLIEPDFSLYVQKKVEQSGIRILVGTDVEEIGGVKSVKYVRASGQKIETSMVIFATGVRPSVKLAERSGIKFGRYGIHVDGYMRTSVPEIYAAGDCVETLDLITKKGTYVPIGSIAAQQGGIAGINAAGGSEKCEGFLRAQSDNVFGLEVSSIGHGSVTAKELGIKVSLEDMKTPSTIGKRSYFQKKYPVKVKVSVDQKGKVVGAQVIGYRFTTQNFYALFQAIRERMTVNELRGIWKLPIATMVDFSMLKLE